MISPSLYTRCSIVYLLSRGYVYNHVCFLDAEGRVVSVDSESLEDGSNTKTSKQRPADKTKTKAGRTKKAGSGAGVAEGSCWQKRAAHVSLVKHDIVSNDLVLLVSFTIKACSVNELKLAVLKYFKSDKQLYQDILLFKVCLIFN